jgi:hypothetical protein
MLRQLLTLLAVLTGLTTAVAPAHALDVRSQAVAITQEMAPGQAQVAAVVREEAQALRRVPAPLAVVAPLQVARVIVPAVIIQVDRAHE